MIVHFCSNKQSIKAWALRIIEMPVRIPKVQQAATQPTKKVTAFRAGHFVATFFALNNYSSFYSSLLLLRVEIKLGYE